MKYEVIKKYYVWKAVAILSIFIVIILAISFMTTKAKYKEVQTFNIVKGRITYSSGDFNVLAVYIKKDNCTPTEDDDCYKSQDYIPNRAYVLSNKSSCMINGLEDENIKILYPKESRTVTFVDVTQKGTKCNLYFDKDINPPSISSVYAGNITSSSFDLFVEAIDNETSVDTYAFKINNSAWITDGSWQDVDGKKAITIDSNTIQGLDIVAGEDYDVTIKVIDEAGNEYEENLTVKAYMTLITNNSPESYIITYKYRLTESDPWIEKTINIGDDLNVPYGSTIQFVTCNDMCGGNYSYLSFYDSENKYMGQANRDRGTSYTFTGAEVKYYYFSCFTEDTEILVYDEKKKRKLKRKVKDIKVGDKIYSYDEDKKKIVVSIVTKIEEVKAKAIYIIKLKDEVIKCSGGHKFYLNETDFVQACELKKGYKLMGMDGSYHEILDIAIEHFEKEITLYNIYTDNRCGYVSKSMIKTYLESTLVLAGAMFINPKLVLAACDCDCMS